MTKKIFLTLLATISLCLCCSICFAAENNSVTLGNEVVKSIDKTSDSFNNLISGNAVNDMGNSIKDGMNNMINEEKGMINNTDNMNREGNYNTVQTTGEEGIANNGINAMSTTTWMWIILAIAAIIIIAAIWYYAVQSND